MGDHVFLCYARKDEDFVLKLAANLKQRGAPVWLDQWDIPPSADWDLTIDDALYDCARFLIVLSPASRASREVRGELRTALDEDKPIIPVLYQTCRVPRQLRLIQHVDFTSSGPDDEALLGQVLRAVGVPIPETSEVSETSEVLPRPRARQPFEPEMILIPAGEFLMGSDPNVDKDVGDVEQPQHTLYLPEYYIAKTPVTNAEYAVFVKATGCRTVGEKKGSGLGWIGSKFEEVKGADWQHPRGPKSDIHEKGDHPVVQISLHDVLAFCQWLGQETGRPYRLPSEAEWEKAARGTDGRIYPWGNRWDAKQCNTSEGGKGGTTPVGDYPRGAGPYGLLDMAGNVGEWTRSLWGEDCFEPSFRYPYDTADGRESLDAPDGILRVLRGGSWYYDRRFARCASRDWFSPDLRLDYLGFRVAASLGSP